MKLLRLTPKRIITCVELLTRDCQRCLVSQVVCETIRRRRLTPWNDPPYHVGDRVKNGVRLALQNALERGN
jgi:hypothetical protein